jgi:hypothetical protein
MNTHYKHSIGWHLQRCESHLRNEAWLCLIDECDEIKAMAEKARAEEGRSKLESEAMLMSTLNPYPNGRWS